MDEKLAIHGGAPVRAKSELFPPYEPLGQEEKEAVVRVMDSGVLSKYIGAWTPDFYGGPEVQALEREWEAMFKVKHAIAMNSATSGLIAAMGAIQLEPGDEVIVTPYSMVISATAPLFYGAIPVFADVEPEYFCLDPKSVEEKITPRTRAILVVDNFGGSHDVEAIHAIAKKHNLYVVEDTAQAPGALYKDGYVGTLADIGVYSLNFHKHIHTGEGSVVVTNDDALAERLELLRNHAEAVVEAKGVEDITNMVGYNFRMTELHAAIAREQLKKLDRLITERRKNCAYIAERCQDMPGFRPAQARPGTNPVYYLQPFLYDEDVVGVSRAKFLEAVKAELPATTGLEDFGPMISGGYVKPIYLRALFAKQIAFGRKGYPFTSPLYTGSVRYEKGMCPVVESLHERVLITHEMMRPGMTTKDLDAVVEAFHKVYRLRHTLV